MEKDLLFGRGKINAYNGVDLEIPELLVWEKDIKRDKFTNYTITCHENITCFVGKLESASGDGCCIVRLEIALYF